MVRLTAAELQNRNDTDLVNPAQMRIQWALTANATINWVPACAGITVSGESGSMSRLHRIDSYKSFQSGFISSINRSFHARFHFLRRFSWTIAVAISSCSSK